LNNLLKVLDVTQPACESQSISPQSGSETRAPNNEGDPSTSPSSQRQYHRVNDQTTARSEPCQALCLAEPQPTRTGVQFHWRWAYSYSLCLFCILHLFGHFQELTWLFCLTVQRFAGYTSQRPGLSLSSDPTGVFTICKEHRVFGSRICSCAACVCFAGVDMSGDLAVNCDLTQTRVC